MSMNYMTDSCANVTQTKHKRIVYLNLKLLNQIIRRIQDKVALF